MNNDSFEFLKSIEETPSVTGFESPVARIVRDRMKKFGEVSTDVHGNVIVAANAGADRPRVMLAGHMDQIGLMINYITDEGFLYFRNVGGIDATVLPGSRVTIHNASGGTPIEGVIGRKPVHLMKAEERGNGKVELENLWIDIGAKNKADALTMVNVGDIATYRLGLVKLANDLIASPGLDNKVGTFVCMEALRLCVEAGGLKCAVYSVATVQEEIGLRGARTSAFGIDPHVGIAVDVTHASDNPGVDKKVAGDVKLGGGAVIERGANINEPLFKMFVDTAKAKNITHQLAAAPGATGTDANAIQLTRAGVATGLISIPNRYMHTQVEVCHLGDLEACAKLIAETILRIDATTGFIPE
jgi:tetrahedral aminopeptidase